MVVWGPTVARQAKQVSGVYEKNEGSGIWYIRYRTQGKLVRKKVGTHSQAKDYLDKLKLVRATGDGDVTGAAMGAGYGREIVLDHGHDLRTVYGHLSAIAVLPGQHVIRGQVIGYVGQSGRATGPHLHYEVRVHNVPVNPHKYLRNSYDQVAGLDGGAAGSAVQ